MKQALRILVAVVLVGWLLHRVVTAPGVDVAATLRDCEAPWLGAAALTWLLGLPLMAVRWRMLLRVQGVELGLWTILRLLLVGNFFNVLVPGSVGGDVARAAVVSTHAGPRRLEAMLTIVVDRILGLCGLLVLALIAVLYAGRDSQGAVRAVAWGLGLLASVGLATLAALAAWPRWRHTGFAAWLRARLPQALADALRRVLAALALYREQPWVLGRGLLCSVGVHAVVTLVVVLVARAVGERGVTAAAWLLAVQVANVVASVPLTPGGVGGRDYVLFVMLTQAGAGAARAGAIPIIYTVIVTVWSALGGLVYLCTREAPCATSIATG